MSSKTLHPVRRTARLTVVAALLAILSGCQAVISNAPLTQVRVIDASPDAPGLDIYQGSTALAFNLGFGTVTSYVAFTPGIYTIAADSAGTKQTLSSSKTTFAASTQYTVLVGNITGSLQQVVLTDQSQPAPAGQISLRFIDQATRVGAVDIYLIPAGQTLVAASPVVTGVVFGTNTGYLSVPTGTYTLVMYPSGTTPTGAAVPSSTLPNLPIATYTGAQVTYSGGAARTFVLIDQQLLTTPGLQVVTAEDYNSPTATN
jgi:Domain of unknown function (DUF4397)